MMELLANVPPSGGYFSLGKIILMLVLVGPWLALAPWVHRDSARVRARPGLWEGGVLLAGTLATLLWLVIPIFMVGLMMYMVITGGALGAYIVYRNGRLPANRRILTPAHIASLLSHNKGNQVQVVNRVRIYDSSNKVVPIPAESADGTDKASYNLIQELFYDLLWRRASEADLSPTGQQSKVRFVIDGVLVERPPMTLVDSEALIQRLKPLAGMQAEERRRPQQGKLSVDLGSSPVDMMLATTGTTGGQRLQIKIVQQFIQTDLESLGMGSDVLQKVRAVNRATPGLVIISGRPGGGVTSTLYSLLREHDAFTRQLVTVESKPTVEQENIAANAYGDISKLSGVLAHVLRRDPDVIMIDRCEDAQSAGMIVGVAGRKNALLGMAATDSFVALAKWIKVVGDPGAAVANLRAVLCQLLIRKLCPSCREAYRPDPALLAKANLPAQKIANFYRPPSRPLVDDKGHPVICNTCQGSGYFGRTAVFELLEMTGELRQLVAAGAPLTQVQASCRKNKMLYLQEQALRKVIEGVTSIQEIIRVSQQSQAKKD